ncbi:uncharacterized protein si:ch1073-126c3.2 [Melanotaenia boesemani]|uniref:uncharacterized protein si:ch1073-126c3.2 n=1 Tax=Melanotaenia boesemani TaxID=1250792 RepID=UPI001C055400|nr:uncharacterized protein si:ch1073-126c3.2 [Melanotaenia boesemani]
MALRASLTLLCSLSVLSSSGAQETILLNCSSGTQVFERLSADLKMAAECGEKPPSQWSAHQRAELLNYMRNLTETLHKHQLKECQDAEPKECRHAEVPSNGGLVCVTVAYKRYCKPLCNSGYDFSFLRRSRLFDECSKQTGYMWNSQYIGNKLAVCNEAPIQISGESSAYFPKDQDCLTTKSNSQLSNSVIEVFTTELKSRGIPAEPQLACLVCG